MFLWEYKLLLCPDRSVCILIKTEKFSYSKMLRRELLSVCQAYAESHGNIFNHRKTVCMTRKAKSAKSTVTPLLTHGWQKSKICSTKQISGSCTGYWALRWQKHSDTTAIKILCSKQAASLFSRCVNAVENVLFCSFCTPMYASELCWNFGKSCVQWLRVAYNFGCRALYHLPWRASVSTHDSSCSM